METSLVQQLSLSTFTPSMMPQETLEGMFVQREQLLQSIVQDLAASVDGTKQYLLLVGARGMGKTHFVSLAYHRLKQKSELQERLLIAWLREEEYGVNSWLYLIIEILRSVSSEGIATAEQITKLANLPIAEAEYLANRVLTELIGDKTLLIITENIDKLLFGLGEKEQWKFRAFLQETNCCSILATTPKISDDTSKKEKPFFGFFTPIHLPVFKHTDAVEMLIKIANLSGNTNLANFLATHEGKSRVRALHHLAGGNPRVYALFAQLITEDTLEALLPAVIEMLDKLTPYYQSRVESLGQSDDQQKIVMYLARETRAVTVKEITAQCFISSEKTTSNALKKLKEKGYVISTQRGREVFYEILEVLMRLCLEMKNSRNGDLKLCVDFLRIWYRPHERQEYLEQLEAAGKLEQAKYFRMSLADDESDPIILACKKDLQKYLHDGDTESALQVLQELESFNKIDEIESSFTTEMLYPEDELLYKSEQWRELLKKSDDVLQLKSNDYLAWFKRGFALNKLDRYEEAINSYDRAAKITVNHYETWYNRGNSLVKLGRYEESIKSYDLAIKIEPNKHEVWGNRAIALYELGRYEESIQSFDRVIDINPNHDAVWYNRGLALYELGRYEEAIQSYDHVIQINPNHDAACYNRGLALYELGRYEESIQSCDRVIEINPNNDTAWYNRGLVLARLGRYEKAIDSYDRAIEIEPDHIGSWYNRGNALYEFDRYEEAIESYDLAIEIEPNKHEVWGNRGAALFELGKYEESLQSCDRVIEINPNSDIAWFNRGNLLNILGRYKEAIESYDRAIKINPDSNETRQHLGIALINLIRDWYNKSLGYFNQSNNIDAMTTWQQTFKVIQQTKYGNASDLILQFLDEELLAKFQQPTVRDLLPQILNIYTTAQVLPELGVALTRNLKALQSPTISDYTANEWLKMWQELGKPHPELALALRMLEAGIKYKQNPQDDRIFLSLPQEMRPLLREALGLEQEISK